MPRKKKGKKKPVKKPVYQFGDMRGHIFENRPKDWYTGANAKTRISELDLSALVTPDNMLRRAYENGYRTGFEGGIHKSAYFLLGQSMATLFKYKRRFRIFKTIPRAIRELIDGPLP